MPSDATLLTPPKVGPTFMNAFYNSYNTVDNSVDINGERVDISGSVIGNGNTGNA